MEIQNIVMHKVLEKNQGFEVVLSPEVFDSNDETIIKFMTKIIQNFNHSKPNYGRFDSDTVGFPFQTYIRDYIDSNSFYDMTVSASNHLRTILLGSNNAKGGFLLYCQYMNTNGYKFLITAMLDETVQFKLGELHKNLVELDALDVDKLARANRLNINKWIESEGTDSIYLSFIKGTRGFSNYFYNFIGCTDQISTAKKAMVLRTAINSYMEREKYTDQQKIEKRTKIKEYLDNAIKEGNEIQLDTISTYINDLNNEDFLTYVSDNEYPISSTFKLNKADTKMFVRTIIKENNIKLEFDTKLINDLILRKGNNLIIKGLSKEVLDNVFK